jgi:tetratricopeptide (TPR) repeat protein
MASTRTQGKRLDAERWRRTRELFDRLADAPPASWDSELAQLCSDDAEIRAEALALLRADAQTAAPTAAAARVVDAAAEEQERREQAQLVGQRVGPYSLLREIGRGGMGHVWLAERADGEFKKLVAIKLLRSGWDADELLQRFRAERQILAGLTHPNIAHLVDGGVTPDGKPWLALEYVDGVNLREFCNTRQLNLRARLQLFLDVCDAVAYAHARLVVHRDLKPSNLLVDHAGSIKLLDFGIAKLLGADSGTSATRLFTPEYAAPEQVRGEAVTTSVDVYALGLLLYELLTGRRPYKVNDSTPAAYERAILEQEPTRPSIAVTRADETAGNLAAQRHLTPSLLARELRGDLDAIVMKALRKEPAQRYASAAELAADVQRHLDRQPVLAHRGGWKYRAGRFLQRHAVAASLSALAVLCLIGGMGLAFWQASLARHEASKSKATLDFMIGIFEGTAVGRVKGREVKAADLLDAAIERVRSDVTEPEARSDLLIAIISAYRALKLGADTLPIAEEALTLARKFDDPVRLGRSLVLHAAAMHDTRRFDELLRDTDEAEKILTGDDDVQRKLRMRVIQARSNAFIELNRPREAEQALSELYDLQKISLGPLHPLTLNTLTYRAAALSNAEENDRATAILEPAIEALKKQQPPQKDYIASLSGMLAANVMDEDLRRAIELARDVLRMEEEIYGPEDTLIVNATINLASFLVLAGDTDEALRVSQRGVDIMHKSGDDPAQAFKPLRLLGQIHVRRREYALAAPVLDEAIAVRDKPDAKADASLANAYASRAIARSMLQRDEEAARDAARADVLIADANVKDRDMLQYLLLRSRFDLLSNDTPSDCARQERIVKIAQERKAARVDSVRFGSALLAACQWRLAPGEASWKVYAEAAATARQQQVKDAFRLALLDDFERQAGGK